MQLDSYFERIGYDGPTSATLDTLNGIALAHIRTIPFENIDPVLGRGVDLRAESIERKLIHERRGGYCFEQNSLLLAVLGALGFKARGLGARVRFGRPRDYTPARTHLFASVDVEGHSWLADVGLGGISPTAALRLDTAGEQPTPHEPRRIVHEGAAHFHQMRLGDQWHDVCEFTLEDMLPIDRELANWYTSTHPQSYFTNNLMVARALPDGVRLHLVNRELALRRRDGSADVQTLSTHEQLIETLRTRFGLFIDAGTEIKCAGLNWATADAAQS